MFCSLSAVENQKVVLSEVQQSPMALEDILPPLNISMSTDKIFAPKTKDMEEGYYMPPEIKKDAKGKRYSTWAYSRKSV